MVVVVHRTGLLFVCFVCLLTWLIRGRSSLRGGQLEGARDSPEGVPFQVALDRLRKPHVPPQRGRDVRVRVPGRHQPDLEPHVR